MVSLKMAQEDVDNTNLVSQVSLLPALLNLSRPVPSFV